MCDETMIAREAQLEIRRQLDLRGIPLKLCASKARVGMSTFLSWFPNPEGDKEPQVMGWDKVRNLIKREVFPNDILSLLLDDGWHIVKAPEDLDHDEFEKGVLAFLEVKGAAHHPNSPAGREISPCENEALNVVRLPLQGKVG